MNGNAPEQVLRGILFMGSFPPAAVFVERRIAGVEILGVEVSTSHRHLQFCTKSYGIAASIMTLIDHIIQ